MEMSFYDQNDRSNKSAFIPSNSKNFQRDLVQLRKYYKKPEVK